MLVIDVPRDVEKIEAKILFKLTKKQLLGLLFSALIGVPVYFFCSKTLGLSLDKSLILAMVCMMPGMFWMNDRNEVSLTKRVQILVKFYFSPKKRLYRSESVYKKKKKAILEKEVLAIVEKDKKKENKTYHKTVPNKERTVKKK